jgi:NADPH:quinone reductase-like Zn-dependent oxidoreductase
MQALWFNEHGTADVLRLGEVPDPVAGPGEVLIRVRAAACNFNDIWARQGLERVHIPLPHISGTEAAGEVVAVGPRVTEWKPGDAVITYPLRTCRRCAACLAGDEVFCRQMLIWGFQTGPYDGAYAQYAKLQAQQLQPKPAHLDWTDAAAISSTLLIAWRMLVTRCQLRGGETVLIWGASGGTGSVAIRLVRLLGGVPIAVTSSDEKAAFCMAQGAEHVLRVDKEDVAARARKLTGGGVDIVFDHVGADVFEASVGALRWGGRFVTCGATTGYNAPLDLRMLWNKQLSLLGSHVGNHREWVDSNKLVAAGRITAPVTEVVSLADLPDVQRRMASRGVMGKIAVRID